MRNCISEETFQAWFDGELTANEAATVDAHLIECRKCAQAARTVETENLMVSKALAIEFEATIPTERLRERVATAVAGLQHAGVSTGRLPLWHGARELFSSFRPLAYASIVIAVLLGGFVTFISLNKEQTTIAPPEVVRSNSVKVPPTNAIASNEKPTPNASPLPAQRKSRRTTAIKRSRTYEPDAFSLTWQQRQYDYAISRLDEAIKVQPAMRPSVQVEYAYNIAVLDNAIATGRVVARRNPKDPHATQFLLDAYQSKVDLMNQIANPRFNEE